MADTVRNRRLKESIERQVREAVKTPLERTAAGWLAEDEKFAVLEHAKVPHVQGLRV